MLRNAAGRVLSHRARSHLGQACLAAATHRVLLEEARVGSSASGIVVAPGLHACAGQLAASC
jgi:hypothetical protein